MIYGFNEKKEKVAINAQDEILLTDPTGDGNLLARYDEVAVRDGQSELATFTQDGVALSDGQSELATFTQDGIELSDGTESTSLFGSDSARIGKVSGSHVLLNDDGSMKFSKGTTDLLSVAATEISSTQAQAEFDGLSDDKWGGGGIFIHSNRMENETETQLYSRSPNNRNSTNLYLYSDKRIESDRYCNVLWTGTGYLMTADHRVHLNGSVENQVSGIVLVWSRYANKTVYNDCWSYQFIPKWHTLTHDDGGVYFSMPISNSAATVCNKYLYISNDLIRGHVDNDATGTGYSNNARVLRAVLGV